MKDEDTIDESTVEMVPDARMKQIRGGAGMAVRQPGNASAAKGGQGKGGARPGQSGGPGGQS
jgi:hypothetical protein